MNKMASAMTAIGGERVALSDVAVSARLCDLLAEVTVAQTYRNDESSNIEAVYTFPLPVDAVLLELELAIGNRRLKGVVVERKAAEEQYEDAVEAGDTAVMLQVIEPGLYTMNVGNLLPGETATIKISYAMLYRWTEDRLRLLLPTTVAPRYGRAIHLPHQTPESSLGVENMFSLDLEILGALSDAQFSCPSHEVTLAREPNRCVVALRQPKAVMDRDFVLNVKARQPMRDFVLGGADGEGTAAIVCLQPFFPGLRAPRPLDLVIVVDCSGSMQGDSIAQARQAVERIVDGLQGGDRLGIVAFGSSTKCLDTGMLRCDATNLESALRFAKALDADMGGTEIGAALHAAFYLPGTDRAADILLVTDGEISEWQRVVQEAKAIGHRIFTVGVGSAISEAFLRELSDGTGGACELVSPREDISDRVVRQFERMRAPRATAAAILWPENAVDVTPRELGAVFEGDTVVSSARFPRRVEGAQVTLEMTTCSGEVHRQEVAGPVTDAPGEELSTVARLAAALRLRETDDAHAARIAVRYRLVSPWTHWIVVAERPEGRKATDLPTLRTVPQTLAAGWGGTGSIRARASIQASRPAHGLAPAPIDAMFACYSMPPSRLDAVPRARFERAPRIPTPPAKVKRLLEIVAQNQGRLDPAHALALLTDARLRGRFARTINDAARLGISPDASAVLVIAGILRSPRMRSFLSGAVLVRLEAFLEHADELHAALETLALLANEIRRRVEPAAGLGALRPENASKLAQLQAGFLDIPRILAELRDAVDAVVPATLGIEMIDDAVP
jgi:Ca-activated chloride channel family protein